MEKKRNYGIDLLKIITTTMVIILHLLVHGGVQENLVPFSKSYSLLWFLGIACDCAVNCFAIISGYVSYETKFKYTSIIRLHLAVLFHAVVLTILVSCLFNGGYNNENLLMSFFPVYTNMYWYYTAFFGLFFFTPLLNKGMQMLDKKQENLLLGGILLFMSIIPTITGIDLFSANKGFSLLWLAVLYLIGCFLKKHKDDLCKHKLKLLMMYIFCILFTWGLKLLLEYWSMMTTGSIMDFSMLTDYCSPTILFAAIALVLLFSEMKVPGLLTKIISFLVPFSFSVYLIHEHPLIRQTFISGKMIYIIEYQPWEQIIALIQGVMVIWIACMALECIRRCIFRIFSVDKILKKIEQSIENINLQ